jgi:hypothetical protein
MFRVSHQVAAPEDHHHFKTDDKALNDNIQDLTIPEKDGETDQNMRLIWI